MNRLTPEGESLIKNFEGLRLHAYRDPVGIKTIGFGHVMVPGLDGSDTIAEAEAEEMFRSDVARFGRWIAADITAPLNDNQYSALVSLVFNEGTTPLHGLLGRFLNAGKYEAAAGEFARWVYAGGCILEGLVARRKAERELFLKPITEDSPCHSTT